MHFQRKKGFQNDLVCPLLYEHMKSFQLMATIQDNNIWISRVIVKCLAAIGEQCFCVTQQKSCKSAAGTCTISQGNIPHSKHWSSYMQVERKLWYATEIHTKVMVKPCVFKVCVWGENTLQVVVIVWVYGFSIILGLMSIFFCTSVTTIIVYCACQNACDLRAAASI